METSTLLMYTLLHTLLVMVRVVGDVSAIYVLLCWDVGYETQYSSAISLVPLMYVLHTYMHGDLLLHAGCTYYTMYVLHTYMHGDTYDVPSILRTVHLLTCS